MSSWVGGSDLFKQLDTTPQTGGYSGGYDSGANNYETAKFSPENYSGGFDGGFGMDTLTNNANRAFAWFIAGIVASVIVAIVFMLIALVLGFGFNVSPQSATAFGSPMTLVAAGVVSVGVGFAVAGSVYEGWVGCKPAF